MQKFLCKLTFSGPHNFVSALLDTSTFNARALDLFQVLVINLVPGAGILNLAVSDYQLILSAIGQMPHLRAAVTALGQSPIDFMGAAKELWESLSNDSERQVLLDTLVQVGITGAEQGLKETLGFSLKIILSLKDNAGIIFSRLFQYPAGGVRFESVP